MSVSGRGTVRRACLAVAVALMAFGALGARAAVPADGLITPARPEARWEGGPLTGIAIDPAQCPISCDEFIVDVKIPAGYWKEAPGGVVIRIEWEDANDEFDLVVYDAAGDVVGAGIEFHTRSEQVLLPEAASGRYRVVAHGFAVTAASYRGIVRLDRQLVPRAAAGPNTMRFAPPTLVDPQMWVAMPSLWAARDGQIFVTAPWGLTSTTSFVWRSRNAGEPFELLDSRIGGQAVDPRRRPCSASTGGGDTDIVVDRTGRVYQSDAEGANVAVAVSDDDGDSWFCNAIAASVPEQDRPWLAPAPNADGPDGPNDDAYLAYRDLASGGLPVGEKVKPLQLHLDTTTDGGLTWQARNTTATGIVGSTGPLFAAPDGTLYQVFQSVTSVWIARYSDGGATAESIEISRRFGSPANIWMAGDADAAGNVYVAWAESGTFDILVSRSSDRGDHWSEPLRVSPPAAETSVMPWLAAGKAGDVAVGWYGTETRAHPESATGARWYVWVARSLNAASTNPRYETARMSETPMHFGALCLEGLTCTDRRFGEFFEIDIAPDGALVAVFDDAGRIATTTDGVTPGPYVTFMRQVSGLGMGSAVAADAPERRGDARLPGAEDADGPEQLDLADTPSATRFGDVMRIQMTLTSAAELTSALEAAGQLVASEAKWIAIWKANDRVEYAGMRVDRQGAVSFFGGDQPVGVARPEPNTPNNRIEKFASYPATFTLDGRVDEATGTISIDVPLAAFHLKPGDTLHGLQAFSMTGLLANPIFLTSNLVLDVTPSRTVRISDATTPAAAPPGAPRPRTLPATGVGTEPLGVSLLAAAAAVALALAGRRKPAAR